MCKVIINKCFGGFGLSTNGMEHYLKLKGIDYETTTTKWKWRKDDKDFYRRGHVGDNAHYLSDRDIDRNDPALIQTVEELGDVANGFCSQLTIVEIPDDVKWQIEEHDGNEWVAEQHRTWR